MYAKVYSMLWDGTLAESWEAWSLFVFMLAHANIDGVVDMTPGAMSRRSCIPLDLVQNALAVLEAPDPQSRTDTDDGRRIVRLHANREWGWLIVNYDHYRTLRDEEARREANRVAAARLRRRRAGHELREEGVECLPGCPACNRQQPSATVSTLGLDGNRHQASSQGEGEGEGEASPSSLRSDGEASASPRAQEPRTPPPAARQGASPAPGASEVVPGLAGVPTANFGDWRPTTVQVEAWRLAYPGVDIERQLAAMRAWAIANPTRRKTLRGMPAFANRWLAREQDEPRRAAAPARGGARKGSDARYAEANASGETQ